MINDKDYVVLSLELHMFFARIMKEHSLFLEAGFTPKNADYARTADNFKKQFENVLLNAVKLGNGIISENVVASHELITNYTLGTEEKTQNFTGIPINKEITRLESNLYGSSNPNISQRLIEQVKSLNATVKPLLNSLIDFKNRVLNNMLSCRMFTANYPLLIEHIIREANMYKKLLTDLENRQDISTTIKETELFWDQIMMEHALFIRGLLDPTENALIKTADNFANEYDSLINQTLHATDRMIESVKNETLAETIKYREFKEVGTKGISECKIRSIILPLLADHVLREANHYIRLLKEYE